MNNQFLFRMPKAIGEEWLKALRSGKYKKGSGMLFFFIDCEYCALGVCGKVCGLNDNDLIGALYFNEKPAYNNIPKELMGSDKANKFVRWISNLNDREEKTFAEIADLIQYNVEFY